MFVANADSYRYHIVLIRPARQILLANTAREPKSLPSLLPRLEVVFRFLNSQALLYFGLMSPKSLTS